MKSVKLRGAQRLGRITPSAVGAVEVDHQCARELVVDAPQAPDHAPGASGEERPCQTREAAGPAALCSCRLAGRQHDQLHGAEVQAPEGGGGQSRVAALAALGARRAEHEVRPLRPVVVEHGVTGIMDDGRALEAANVVWCTGFHPGFSWIDLPVFGEGGEPMHERGIVATEPGLYFVGLHFLYAMSSMMIHGVGRDAERVAEAIAKRAGSSGGADERRPELVAAVSA